MGDEAVGWRELEDLLSGRPHWRFESGAGGVKSDPRYRPPRTRQRPPSCRIAPRCETGTTFQSKCQRLGSPATPRSGRPVAGSSRKGCEARMTTIS